jgi:hypothetical protein
MLSRLWLRRLAATTFLLSCIALSMTIATAAETKDTSRSLAAWDMIVPVLQNPRCMNCHQAVIPRQGDDRHLHQPLVVRGIDGHGAAGMRCVNCHNGSGNNETSGTPGAGGRELWQLAPISMLWQGLSSGDLCRMLKDTARNGNRDGAALVEHMETEPLVLWGWNPGGQRQPVSMPHDEFIDQMKMWVANGQACPM